LERRGRKRKEDEEKRKGKKKKKKKKKDYTGNVVRHYLESAGSCWKQFLF
jgi:hypothetical protein